MKKITLKARFEDMKLGAEITSGSDCFLQSSSLHDDFIIIRVSNLDGPKPHATLEMNANGVTSNGHYFKTLTGASNDFLKRMNAL